MLLHLAYLLALLPLSLAHPFLLGYSTSDHFACAGTSCASRSSALPSTSLRDLLTHLSAPASAAPSDLPLHPDFASQPAPALTLVVRAETSSAKAVLPQLATAIGGPHPTSFVARAHAFDHPDTLVSVKDLANLKLDAKHVVINVQLNHGETTQLMESIRALSSRGSLAVLWASRQDADAAADADGAEPPAAEGDTAVGDVAAAPDSKEANVMNPPEINSAALSGLLVALIFLLIFVPGFMCLTNITAPETFEIMDSNDMKKKMQ